MLNANRSLNKFVCSSLVAFIGGVASVPASAVTFQYEVFQSASSDVPVGTLITVDLGLSSVPAQTSPPYDSGAPGEDQLTGANNSRFDDLGTLNLSFLGRDIDAAMGEVVTFNGFSYDQFRVAFSNATQTEISAVVASDLDFFIPSQGTSRTLTGINMEFRGPTSLLSNQYVDDALAIVEADPFAWDGIAGVGPTTQAPRRLQFVFGAPGFPEINATLVPVPAALWLFGSGLLGLVGIARRKQAA